MRLLLLALAAAAVLAGCGDGPAWDDAPQDAQGRHVVRLTAGNAFEPDRVEVPRGATVVWVGEGGAHDVNADDGSFSSSERGVDAEGYPLLIQPGEEWAHTFPQAGRWTVWCHTHHEMGMRMELKVS